MYWPFSIAHPGSRDRAEERDAGQRQRRRATDQCDDVGVVLQVVAEHGGHHLDFIAEVFRKQRPDRPVDQAGLQHLGLGWPAFALEEAAGNFAGGERLFLVIDRQREKVLPRSRGPYPDGRAQHDRVAVAGHDRAISLTGDLTRLQDQLAPSPVEFLAVVVEHSYVLADAGHRRTVDPSAPGAHTWAGGGVSGRMDGAGCVAGSAAQPRAMWPETPSRVPHLGSPERRGQSVRRVTAAFGGDSRPPRRCPVPPWPGGRRRYSPYRGTRRRKQLTAEI